MTAQKPSVGRIVHYLVDPRLNHGEEVAAAVVTKVNESEDGDTVNLRVFLDDGSDLRVGGVSLESKKPKDDDEDAPQRVALWPARS